MKRLIASLLFCPALLAAPPESPFWKEFRDAPDRAPSSILPDFSYAGYRHGEESIPDVKGPVFNVQDFGALPDDAVSDEDAIRKAIAAAEKSGGGVVYFPAGTYLLWTDRLKTEPLKIGSSKIVLRGAGSSRGGTVLHFIHHGLEKGDYKVPKTGPDFKAVRYLVQAEAPESHQSVRELRVTEDAPRASFRLKVADTAGLQPGQWVSVNCKGGALSAELLAEQTPPQEWKKANAPLSVSEHHQIRAIEGKTLVLHEPLEVPVFLESRPTVAAARMLEEVGIEDLAFRGNWVGAFSHHQTGMDDEAWDAVLFKGVANGWIRRCAFLNTNTAVYLRSSAACSVIQNRIAGTPAHYGVTVRSVCTWVLQGLSEDFAGQVHGPSVGNSSSGVVVWRWKTKENASFDSHGNMPFATLVDRVDGGTFTRSGGPTESFPNHLRWLIFWNFDYQGSDVSPVDFWSTTSKVAKFAKPWMVGLTGKPLSFVDEHLGVNDSPGVAVAPESLYEAQLALRLGRAPEWVETAKAEWAALRKQPLPIFSERGRWSPEDAKALHPEAFPVRQLLEDVQLWFGSLERVKPVALSLSGDALEIRADWGLLHQLVCNAVVALGTSTQRRCEVEVRNASGAVELRIKRNGPLDNSKKGTPADELEEARRETLKLAEFLKVEVKLQEAAGELFLRLPQ